MTRQRATGPPTSPGGGARASRTRVSRTVAAVTGRYSGVEKQALTAALEQLALGGVKGLTIEGVAARAGVAKTTLYRRWRSKEDLALAVLLEMARMATTAPTTGDIRTRLINYLDAVVTILRETLMGPVMQGLSSDLATDPEMAEAFRREVIALRQEHLADLVHHGVQSGELRPDVDLALLQELLFGPVYYRLLFSGHRLTGDLAKRIVDAVLPGLLTRPRGR